MSNSQRFTIDGISPVAHRRKTPLHLSRHVSHNKRRREHSQPAIGARGGHKNRGSSRGPIPNHSVSTLQKHAPRLANASNTSDLTDESLDSVNYNLPGKSIKKYKKFGFGYGKKLIVPLVASFALMAGTVSVLHSREHDNFVVSAINLNTSAHTTSFQESTRDGVGQVPTSGLPSEQLRLGSENNGSSEIVSDVPVRLVIPHLQVDAPVTPLGLDVNKSLLSPATIFDTGWYIESAKPGSEGVVILNAHSSGPSKQGALIGAKTLVPGDILNVINRNGTSFNYSLVKTESFSDKDFNLNKLYAPVVTGKQGLALVVGFGPFDAHTHHHQTQVVLYAIAK